MNKLPDMYGTPCHLKFRGVYHEGMTVRQLIHELQLQNMDSKVIWYDKDGCTHSVIDVVQDGKRTVAIF